MNKFSHWLLRAAAGDEFEYARGDLIKLRGGHARTPEAQCMVDNAALAWAASKAGEVLLVQRRVGEPEEGVMAYVAIRRAVSKRAVA